MAKHVLVVYTNAAKGRDDDFNDWYDNIHIGEVLALPGFLSAQRFRVGDTQMGPPPSHRYLALYEFEADSLADVSRSFIENAGKMKMSDAIDLSTAVTHIYTATGPRKTKK